MRSWPQVLIPLLNSEIDGVGPLSAAIQVGRGPSSPPGILLAGPDTLFVKDCDSEWDRLATMHCFTTI
jgi:hypothetical protein